MTLLTTLNLVLDVLSSKSLIITHGDETCTKENVKEFAEKYYDHEVIGLYINEENVTVIEVE